MILGRTGGTNQASIGSDAEGEEAVPAAQEASIGKGEQSIPPAGSVETIHPTAKQRCWVDDLDDRPCDGGSCRPVTCRSGRSHTETTGPRPRALGGGDLGRWGIVSIHVLVAFFQGRSDILAAAVAPLDDEDAAEAAFLPFRLLLALDMEGVLADAEAADLAGASLLPRVLLGLCLLVAEAISPAPPSASPASSSIASSSFMIASSSSR